MKLKNYTTSIAVEKTISEIEKILAISGASHIFKMYDDAGNPQALAFKCLIKGQLIAFKLPMEEEKILQIFNMAVADRELPRRYRGDKEQARRTGWRILKNWIDSQMAMINIHLVRMEEVFLPYMFNEKLGMTMFEMLEKKNFQLGIGYDGEDKK